MATDWILFLYTHFIRCSLGTWNQQYSCLIPIEYKISWNFIQLYSLYQGVTQVLEDNNIHSAFIPAAYTGEFQPMDISVNKVVKSFICANSLSGMQYR